MGDDSDEDCLTFNHAGFLAPQDGYIVAPESPDYRNLPIRTLSSTAIASAGEAEKELSSTEIASSPRMLSLQTTEEKLREANRLRQKKWYGKKRRLEKTKKMPYARRF